MLKRQFLLKKTQLAFSVALMSGAVLSGCAMQTSKVGPTASENTQFVEYFADNAVGNPLAIVQHPAAIHQNGITYVSYQGPKEDPFVATYDHRTKEWKGPFKAGTSELGRRDGGKKFDNHGKPTMLIDNEGYIHIFYGGHGGNKSDGHNSLGNTHVGANKHAVSKRPYDITEWEDLDNITPFGTYNQVVKMDNGDIYLFFRHGAHRSDWVYQKSVDNGRTFSAPVSFLKHKRRTDLKAVDSWYAWVGKGEGDNLIVSYDYHICWDSDAGRDDRGHTPERHDLYFMKFNTQTNEWSNVKGEALSLPVTKEMADEKTLAMKTGELWTFNGTSHLDSKGNPHIAINAGVDIGQKAGGPKQTRHVWWDGEQWLGGEKIIDGYEGVSRGDFLVNGPEDIRYLVAYEKDGAAVLSWWNSNNNGNSFSESSTVLRKENASFAITTLIENAHPEAQMLVAEKESDENIKIYLVGEDGPVPRSLSSLNASKKPDM
ncbi:BNR-4 repeat-containing protein (plasmid) [Alteromonas marina]